MVDDLKNLIRVTHFHRVGGRRSVYVYPWGGPVLTLDPTAVSAVKGIVGSPDFDRRMLLLATSMAHESDMKNLLLTVLEVLLKTLKRDSGLEADVEAITLVRCIVRLVHSLLDNGPHNR
jgi:hypothetical protein